MKYKELNHVQRVTINGLATLNKQSEVLMKTKATIALVLASTGVSIILGVISFVGRLYASRNDATSRRACHPKRVFPYMVCNFWYYRNYHELYCSQCFDLTIKERVLKPSLTDLLEYISTNYVSTGISWSVQCKIEIIVWLHH